MNIKRKKIGFNIPTNAMSDVAFQLLIFIMLVSLINYRKEVPIQFPDAETPKKVNVEHNLEIWVDRDGGLYLNGDYCTIDVIQAGIIDAYTLMPDTRVHIIADRDTSFVYVHQVLELLQILQYREVSFVARAPIGN